MGLPERVKVVEVGPRDGFQMETQFIPTELKVELIDLISESGVSKVEATSFVHPKVIPQMRDAAEVMARIRRRPGVCYTVLVPNLKGLLRAIEAKADSARLVVCVTETYNLRNVGLSVDASLEVCREMLAEAGKFPVEAIIAVAFGCPLEGPVPEERVCELAHRFVDLGVRELGIADSAGLAHPHQVARIMGRLKHQLPDVELSLHLHDTRGLGLANVLAALGEGIDTFDASLGGLGGCPVVTGATGNIATEDLVNLCEETGLPTGVDLDPIRQASRRMQDFLGRKLPSAVLRAGTRAELYQGLAAAPA